MSPIQKLLGLPAEADSPFDLLGLKPGEFTDAAVHEALERRLERLTGHTQGSSHDADEVRLALHAAAAQLLDPHVRAHLIQRAAMDKAGMTAQRPAAGHEIEAYRQAAMRVMALSRRLDRRSRRLLIGLAHAYGLTPAKARGVLRSLRSNRTSPLSASEPAAPATRQSTGGIYESIQEGASKEMARVRQRARSALMGAIVVIVVMLGAAGVVFELTRETTHRDRAGMAEDARSAADLNDTKQSARARDDAARARAFPDSTPSVADSSETLPQEPVSAADARDKLQRAIDLLSSDPGEAAFRFDRMTVYLAREWASASEAETHSLVELIVEYFYRAAPGGEGQGRALASITQRAERLAPDARHLESAEILPAIWAVGVLNRLARGQDLSAQLHREVDFAIATALPRGRPAGNATFSTGVHAALLAALGRMPLEADPGARPGEFPLAWDYWLEASLWPPRPAGAAGNPESDGRVASAIELFLVAGASPALHSESRQVLETLLQSLDWDAPRGEARTRLLTWFDNPQIATADLAFISQSIVNSGQVRGAGADSSLTSAASRQRRRDVRDRLATLWGMRTTPETDSVALAWRRRATDALAMHDDSSSWIAMLWHAAIVARLNEVAAYHWEGKSSAASTALEQAAALSTSPVSNVSPDRSPPGPAGVNSDGEWALSFLSRPRNDTEGRLELLESLRSRSDEIGPVDADVLAEAAFSHSSAAVRVSATTQLLARSHQKWALNGALEALLKAPATNAVSDSIESMTGQALPHVKDPGWRLNARRALVQALLVALTQDASSREVDRLAIEIGRAYGGRVAGGDEGDGGGINNTVAHESATELFRVWLQRAAQFERSERGEESTWAIERRMDGRLQLTGQPIGRFAAHQAGIAELMALVVAAERPGMASVVREVISELGESRRRASSVIMQIRDAELAQLQLWMIRYGHGLSEEDRL